MFNYISGSAPDKPVPVFPWHSLVPFLTNTGPPPISAQTSEQPQKLQKPIQNLPAPVSVPKQPLELSSRATVTDPDGRKSLISLKT